MPAVQGDAVMQLPLAHKTLLFVPKRTVDCVQNYSRRPHQVLRRLTAPGEENPASVHVVRELRTRAGEDVTYIRLQIKSFRGVAGGYVAKSGVSGLPPPGRRRLFASTARVLLMLLSLLANATHDFSR